MEELQSALCRVDASRGQDGETREGSGDGGNRPESDGSDGITCTQCSDQGGLGRSQCLEEEHTCPRSSIL